MTCISEKDTFTANMNWSVCRFCYRAVFHPPCSSDAPAEICILFVNFDLACEKASMYLLQNYHTLITYIVKLAGSDFI